MCENVNRVMKSNRLYTQLSHKKLSLHLQHKELLGGQNRIVSLSTTQGLLRKDSTWIILTASKSAGLASKLYFLCSVQCLKLYSSILYTL